MKLLLENCLYDDNLCAKFQGHKIHPKKDIQNLPISVTIRNSFKATNFNTLPMADFIFSLIIKFLA